MLRREKIYGKFLQKSNTKNKFLEEIAAKIAQKSNTKKTFVEQNAAKIVLFEKKKHFLIFAS